MKKLLALLALLFVPLVSHATTYYVSDCYKLGTLADAACVSGNDTTNNGLSAAAPFKTLNKAASLFNSCAAGDQILLANGAAWFEAFSNGATLRCTATTAGTVVSGVAGVTSANAVYVGRYTPTWGPGTAKPILVSPVQGNMFDIHSGGTVANGGYIFDGLDLRGRGIYTTVSSATATTATLGTTLPAGEYVGCNAHLVDGTGASGSQRGITANTTSTITVANWPNGTPDATTKITLECGQWALAVNRPADGITFKNLTIDGFAIGLNCFGGNPADGEGALQSYRINLYNSTIKNNLSQGLLYSCLSSLIEGNTLDKNGGTDAQPDREHPVYVSWHTPAGQKTLFVFRRNTITNLQGFYSTCATSVIVGHGNADDVLFEGNKLYQAPNSANGGCWGIAMDTGYGSEVGTESFLRLVYRGNLIVNVGGLGLSCTSCVGAVMENNVVISESGPDMIGIAVPNRVKGAEDVATTAPKIRGNTIAFLSPQPFHQGISTSVAADAGTQIDIVGNLIYFGIAASSNHQCFDTSGRSAGDFNNFSYNLCYDTSGNGTYDLRGTPIDTNRLTTNPLFATTPSSGNNFDVSLQSGSPAVSGSYVTGAPKLDQVGCQRGTSTVHRGARQYFPSACTVAPQTPMGFR